MKTRSSTKKNNSLILGLTFLIISNSVFAANKKPADLIVSPGARYALEKSFGKNWENLVNSDPDRFYNGQNKGFLPANWKEIINTPVSLPQKAEKPSDLITDPFIQSELKSYAGSTNWQQLIDSAPDRFLHLLPSNWQGIIGKNDCTYIYHGKCLVPDRVEKPADLIKNKTDIETLTKNYGENWKDEVNNNPDYWAQKGFIPKDWNSRVGADGASSSLNSSASTSSTNSERPSDTVASYDRAFMEEKYGANWEELVNANPNDYTFGKGGKVPLDWLGRSLRPYGSVRPSDLITDSASIEALKEKYGDDWKKHVDLVPEGYLDYLPADWADQIRKGKQTSSNVADNSSLPTSPTPSTSSSTEKRPSDTVASYDRAFMEEKFGPNWEELVNANPDEYTFSKGGKVPNDWLGRSLKPYGSVRPSDLITDSASIEALKEKYGDDWKKHVDLVPEGYLDYLPADWADQIRKGKQTSSNVADSSSSDPSSNSSSSNSSSSNSSSDQGATTGKGMSKNDGGSSVANQLLALGTGIVGSNILITCKLGGLTPSIMAFGAGSMVYIGSEIFGAKAQQAFIKVKKDEIAQLKATMTQGGDLQRGIIEAKIKETEEKLEFVKKRKTWTKAVATMYGAATGLAAVEMACSKGVVTCPKWIAAACEGGTSLPSSMALQAAVVGAYGLAAGNAGGTAVSTFGTALATLGILVAELNSSATVLYQTPEARIATFGVGTALTAKVMADLGKVEGDLKNNIRDLNALLADYDKKTQDAGGISEGPGAVDLAKDNLNVTQGSGNVNRLAAGADLNKHCWGKDSQGRQTYSDEVCDNALTLAKPKYNSKFNLPTLQSVANTGVDMAQAVARGDMGAADIAAANLASNAMRVKDITDKLLNDIAEQQKKAGQKPVDYNKAIQNNLAKMQKDLDNKLRAKGVNLASIPSGTSSLLNPQEELKPIHQINSGDAPSVATQNGAEGLSINLDEGADGIAFGDNSASGTIAAAHTLEDFETQESDILARPEESLFKQLSNRYFLNYDKIFEVKKVVPTQAK